MKIKVNFGYNCNLKEELERNFIFLPTDILEAMQDLNDQICQYEGKISEERMKKAYKSLMELIIKELFRISEEFDEVDEEYQQIKENKDED